MLIDYSEPSYYYPIIILFSCIFGFIQILIWIFQTKDEHHHDQKKFDDDELILIKDEVYIKKGSDLKMKYLAAFLLAKSAMWAKAPYNYMLFSIYYGFDIGTIGILYLIDAFCSLFSGPLIGILADTFGRKSVAIIYPINTVIILAMRISGVVPLVYMAQVMTGFASNVIATSFESWLNYEITQLYGNNKNYIQYFRKTIFSSITFYDSVMSLLVTIISAVIYVNINL